jgi:predicted kinase
MNRPKLILTVGIPGAGKTTYTKEYVKSNPNTIHLSSDTIRAELYGDESIQGNPAEVFSLMQKRAIEALNDGKNVIYDATNITRKDRASIISICPKFVKIECHIIWAPIETCIERDAARERTVGRAVIDRMLKRFQAPFYDECIDEIIIVRPDDWDWDEKSYTTKCFDDMKIPHDNPHHTLDVIDHCWEAKRYLFNKDITDEDLLFAALRHDIGKPYVKAFIDSKGNPCEQAHYYQHQCVGSYMSYGFDSITPYSAWLISTHMDPFLNTKYYNNLPAFLKRDIDLLHEADLGAH